MVEDGRERIRLRKAWHDEGCWDGSCAALRDDGDLEVAMQWRWKMIAEIKAVK